MVYKCTVGEASPLNLDELEVPSPFTLQDLIVSSIEAPNGPAQSSGNITLSSGWDNGSAHVDTGSTDQRGIVRIDAGAAPVGSPSWTMAFVNRWSASPFAMVIREGQVQPIVSCTDVDFTVTQTGAIGSGATIVYHYSIL